MPIDEYQFGRWLSPNYSHPYPSTAVMPVFTGIQDEITFTQGIPVYAGMTGNSNTS
jgi:hypothetical protein